MAEQTENSQLESVAFQDLIPGNHCFGCGPANAGGLRIKSRWLDADRAVCYFVPSPEHSAGPEHVLNGGIIATLIDCHSICTAIANHYREEGRPIGSEPAVWCVTGGLEIRYLAPTPLAGTVMLLAKVRSRSDKKTIIDCTVSSSDTLTAEASVVAIRVPPEWRTAGPL
jgi:acyl-coenzyme A thioesterase PaaI-like protein